MTALITVGIPVHNGAATLARAAGSVLGQEGAPFRLHISDNASSDGTASIGRALAAAHGNVTYTRQERNLGPVGNFRFLLNQADTPWFMWLGADDYLLPGYLARTLAVLQQDPGIVTCVSRVLFARPGGGTRPADGTYPLSRDVRTNIAAFLSDPSDNSRFYGLHRTEALQQSFPAADFRVGFDWAVMAATLMRGRHAELDEALMVREETSLDAYMHQIRRDGGSRLGRFLPMARMSSELVFRQRIPLSGRVLRALVFANLLSHFQYAKVFHPRYARVEPVVRRHFMWRMMTTK
jgi:glycosyltransferase involved in cell wall biosynthesis